MVCHNEFPSAYPISELLKTGFKSYAGKMTGINALTSYNIKNTHTGTYPNITINYRNVLVSRGNLAGVLNKVDSSGVTVTVKLDWEDYFSEVGASVSDKTLLVVYNPT
jgi:hypothetical protein